MLGRDGGGATVGVWKHGEQRVFAYGTARPDSIFEIGSIAKTFTALALAQLVIQGKARLDEPVRELLPPGTVAQHEGQDITLLDLATHRSGLPSIPNNRAFDGLAKPLAGYNTADLYAFMKYWGAYRSPYAPFGYSNLGFGLLGQALANRAGVSYADLLRGITEPLGMHDTVLNLSPNRATVDSGLCRAAFSGWPHGSGCAGGRGSDSLHGRGHGPLIWRRICIPRRLPARTRFARQSKNSTSCARQIAPGASIALSWIYDTASGIYVAQRRDRRIYELRVSSTRRGD